MEPGTFVEVYKIHFDGRIVEEHWLPAVVLYEDEFSIVVRYPNGLFETVGPNKIRRIVGAQDDGRTPYKAAQNLGNRDRPLRSRTPRKNIAQPNPEWKYESKRR